MTGDVVGEGEGGGEGVGTDVSDLPQRSYASQIPDLPDDHLDEYM